jgi:hypothetical protein
MFLLGPIFGAIFSLVSSIIQAVIRVVQIAIRAIARRMAIYAFRGAYTGQHQAKWEFILFQHIDWKRALRSRRDAEAETQRLLEESEDNNSNGIPDLYDQMVTSPAQDFLHIKYPQKNFRENDYVRYAPRNLKNLILDPQPVGLGAKGLVRSETINNQGAYAWVKWNAYSRGEGRPSPLYRVNQMDLHMLGHVHDSYRVTQ